MADDTEAAIAKKPKTFLADADDFLKYLQRINPRCRHIQAFKEMICYAILKDGVMVKASLKSEAKFCNKWSVLKKIIKKLVYKDSKLNPRPSDPDVTVGEFEHDFDDIPAGPREFTQEEKTELWKELAPSAELVFWVCLVPSDCIDPHKSPLVARA